MGVPRAFDGKPFHAPNIYPDKNYRYLTGQADDLANPNLDAARGTGPMFEVDASPNNLNGSNNTAPFEFGFVDPVWIAGGSLVPRGAEFGDTCSLQLIAPASTVVEAPGLDGNCMRVNHLTGLPDQNGLLIVPWTAGAPGAGTHNVDLDTAVPIPYGDDWVDQTEGYCFWNWTDGGTDPPLIGRGAISPNYEKKGRFNLLATEVTLVTHARSIPMHGTSSQQTLTLAAIETKLLLPHWKFRVWVHNHTAHEGLKVAFWLDLGRAKT